MKGTIIKAIKILAARKIIFCSEADFQFALAWEIKNLCPNAQIFLEKAVNVNNDTYYVDLIVVWENKYFFIELKYQTSSFSTIDVLGLPLNLKGQAAEDLMRYDYLKDILRLYKIANSHPINFGGGYAIILSNDKLMYEAPKAFKRSLDCFFRIHDRRGFLNDRFPVPGAVVWNNATKGSSHWTRKPLRNLIFVLPLINTEWDTYLSIKSNQKKQEFKFLINEVNTRCASLIQEYKDENERDKILILLNELSMESAENPIKE